MFEEIFEEAGAEGFVHAREVDGEAEVGFQQDSPVVLASVFKIPIVLEYARQAAAGRLSRTERHTVTARYKDQDEADGIGTSGCLDDVTLTLRDLCYFMMAMSDNAATDLVTELVGLDRINATLAELGLKRTRVAGDCRTLIAEAVAQIDSGIAPADIDARDPSKTSASTPREITTLLGLIWRDEAGPVEACAEVRRIMSRQIWPHRLSSGFDDTHAIAAKTGTIWGVRNEAGVVTYPDGRRYAVGVFLRPRDMGFLLPKADAAIGRAARAAIDHLRA